MLFYKKKLFLYRECVCVHHVWENWNVYRSYMNKFFTTRTPIAADIISISLFGLNFYWDYSTLAAAAAVAIAVLITFLIDLFKCRADFFFWLLFVIKKILSAKKKRWFLWERQVVGKQIHGILLKKRRPAQKNETFT